MPEQIISASGTQYGLVVNPDGSINVAGGGSTGSTIITGSIIIDETSPIDSSKNNPYYSFEYITSGTATGVTGSEIGSIVQFIGTGSYVQVFTWSNDLIVNVGSWS